MPIRFCRERSQVFQDLSSIPAGFAWFSNSFSPVRSQPRKKMFRLIHKSGPQQYQHQPIIQKTQDPFVWLLFLRCFRVFICCTGCSPRLLYMDLVVDATGDSGWRVGQSGDVEALGWLLIVGCQLDMTWMKSKCLPNRCIQLYWIMLLGWSESESLILKSGTQHVEKPGCWVLTWEFQHHRGWRWPLTVDRVWVFLSFPCLDRGWTNTDLFTWAMESKGEEPWMIDLQFTLKKNSKVVRSVVMVFFFPHAIPGGKRKDYINSITTFFLLMEVNPSINAGVVFFF